MRSFRSTKDSTSVASVATTEGVNHKIARRDKEDKVLNLPN